MRNQKNILVVEKKEKAEKKLSKYQRLMNVIKNLFPDDERVIREQVRAAFAAIKNAPVSKKVARDIASGKRDRVCSAIEHLANAPLLGVYLSATLPAWAMRYLAEIADAAIKESAKKTVWSYVSDEESDEDTNPFAALKGLFSEQ